MATNRADPVRCTGGTGICPDHGDRLIWTPLSKVCFCGGPGCKRQWNYQRNVQACTEPATKLVTTGNRYGSESDMPHSTTESEETHAMCVGHALAAEQHNSRFFPVTVRPLSTSVG